MAFQRKFRENPASPGLHLEPIKEFKNSTLRTARVDDNYRVVVLDSRKKRDSDYLERLGHYNPCVNPAEIVIDVEKYDEWIKKGAQSSDTVASLVKKVRK